MQQWRGIYFIFDKEQKRGYVGSAYGEDNLIGRWNNYASNGHGGNNLLRKCNPENFEFTILELLSPAANPTDVLRREALWKEKLKTRSPFGLNEN